MKGYVDQSTKSSYLHDIGKGPKSRWKNEIQDVDDFWNYLGIVLEMTSGLKVLKVPKPTKRRPIYPHPPGTNYRISIGLEQIAAGFSPVVKVEMERNGKILKQAPYFPLDSDDYKKVSRATVKLIERK